MAQDSINRTVLSAGIMINTMLAQNTEVMAMTGGRIYAVIAPEDAVLPYIVYGRDSLETNPNKSGRPADGANIGLACYAADYVESVNLAEAVRSALDCQSGAWREDENSRPIIMRQCLLTASSEDIGVDAYIQDLNFLVRI